ncbi:MAG TPA: lysophospholipid acyltransferase family protein [Terriglobia bacterium]|nr:lysophospholipid acyltransferase family protein [Terriglobia bacterium]
MTKAPAGNIDSDSTAQTLPQPPATSSQRHRRFTRWQRFQILMAGWIGTLAVSLVGRTLRWEIHGWENWETARKAGKGLIYTFWHREICAATWFWRQRGIVVMTSQNFDGEYVARIIQRHGYGAARGSSSRGASAALVEMIRCMRRGQDAAFTIDGPRGPRFVAKSGSVILAKATGAAILCFHIAVKKAFVFERSWDRLQIPHLFSRAAVFIAPPIFVDRDEGDPGMAVKQKEVQEALESLQQRGEAWLRGTDQ